jgi:hypothetical protein
MGPMAAKPEVDPDDFYCPCTVDISVISSAGSLSIASAVIASNSVLNQDGHQRNDKPVASGGVRPSSTPSGNVKIEAAPRGNDRVSVG